MHWYEDLYLMTLHIILSYTIKKFVIIVQLVLNQPLNESIT